MNAQRVALVIGGSSGIGRAIAEDLATGGMTTVIASRSAERCNQLAASLRERGGQAIGIAADASDPAAIRSLIEQTETQAGPIDTLVLAAGALVKGPLRDVTQEDLEYAFSTNVFGAIHACREVVPGMTSRGFGRIVLISSVLGTVGMTHRSVYAATKGALAQFAKSIAWELANTGVTVNVVAPGPIAKDEPGTPPDPMVDPAPSLMIDHETLLRRWGAPDDVARVVRLLVDDPTGFVTGAFWPVDGGYTAH